MHEALRYSYEGGAVPYERGTPVGGGVPGFEGGACEHGRLHGLRTRGFGFQGQGCRVSRRPEACHAQAHNLRGRPGAWSRFDPRNSPTVGSQEGSVSYE